MKKILKNKIVSSMLVALAFTILVGSGIGYSLDHIVSDRWYQKPMASEGNIVLIGIDQKALSEIGPIQDWTRDIMAMVIDTLNESEEVRPAVIGVDVLYAGETEPSYDAYLAQACGKYDNVVLASAAEFGDELSETENGTLQYHKSALLAYDEPYEQLRKVTRQGHINAMLDEDGILRHQLWSIQVPTQDATKEVLSFAATIANRYLEVKGMEQLDKPLLNQAGFWYLPYSGKPGDYSESISVADVLWGNVPAEYFADKIVLIGPYTTGLQDHFFTSIDHAEAMYGVECQANAIEALLRGDSKREVSDTIQLVLLFVVLSVLGGFFWKRRVIYATLVMAGVVLGSLLADSLLYQKGMILHVLWIPLGVGIFYVVSIAMNYVQSLLEKRRVTNTFKKYVAPQIVNEILKVEDKDTLTAGGRLVDIAVLFVDIRGFTSMSESLQPNEVVEILNQYLTLIANCILDNGGTLDKFIGDCAMAFWGAPLPQEDYLMRALQAAMDMKKGSESLSKLLLERYGRTVSFGIGVHVGQALVGNIGSPDRMDYTAIGDTVNTASRLEANAPKETIYISKEVVERMGERIQVTKLPEPLNLKGKAEPFCVYTLDKICSDEKLS